VLKLLQAKRQLYDFVAIITNFIKSLNGHKKSYSAFGI